MDRWMQIVYPERFLAYKEAVRVRNNHEDSIVDKFNEKLKIIDSNFQNHSEFLKMLADEVGVDVIEE